MESRRALLFVGISSLAMLAGVLCMLIAVATALADEVLLALATTYIQIGIASFLFAVWSAVVALFVRLEDKETRDT
jgi:Na+-driven multidrug efflux pump